MPESEGLKIIVAVSHANAFVRHCEALIPEEIRANLRCELQRAIRKALDAFEKEMRAQVWQYQHSTN